MRISAIAASVQVISADAGNTILMICFCHASPAMTSMTQPQNNKMTITRKNRIE